MTTILLNHESYTYTISRQKRKTFQIKLTSAYNLEIKIPLQVSSNNVIQVLTEKASWINEKNEELKKLEKNELNHEITDGSKVLFMGKGYVLSINHSLRKPIVQRLEDTIKINLYKQSTTTAAELLYHWYLQQASDYLLKQTNFWCKKMQLTFHQITIKDQKTRWGSCSTLGNINYNWRIIMASQETIDYLIIHELAHRVHLNHSNNFWSLVAQYCPNYQTERKWLQTNGRILARIL